MFSKAFLDDCPAPEQIRDFALGLESDERLNQLAAHVESCEHCRAAVEEIEAGDVLTVALRGSDSTHGGFSEEPAFRQLYRELWEMGRKYAPTIAPDAVPRDEAPSTASQRAGTEPTGEHQLPFHDLPAPFGRYLVRRKLGRGGMGAVYLAWDTQLERDVALKIPTTGRDQAAADRFLREARAAAALDHPNVCPIYDHGQIDGVPYLTLKLIDGRTLAEALDSGPLPVREAVETAQHVAQALDAAHAAGVTHRDLKPGNIMLDAAGRPWVMDFGLARREAIDPALIEDGEIFGTPVYMSPEQAEGQGDRVGAPSDVFSLGVVLYEMLCGRTPFTGNVAKVLDKIRREESTPPSRHRPEIDSRLDAICLKAMAKDPQDRYAGAGEFATALGRYLHTLPAPMPGLDESAEDASALRRKRFLGWALAAAAVVLIALLGFFSLGGGRAVVEVARAWKSEPQPEGEAPAPGQAVPAPAPREMPGQVREKFGEGGEQEAAINATQDNQLAPAQVVAEVEQSVRNREAPPSPPLPVEARVEAPVLLQSATDHARPSSRGAVRQLFSKRLGEARAGRSARWVLRLNRSSPEDLLAQLGGLGAEVAFPQQGGDRYLYFSDLKQVRASEEREISDERRIFFLDDSRASIEGPAAALGVASPRFMAVFLPPALEEKMLRMELDYKGAPNEEAIEQTIFEVVPRRGSYDVIVVDQTLRDE